MCKEVEKKHTFNENFQKIFSAGVKSAELARLQLWHRLSSWMHFVEFKINFKNTINIISKNATTLIMSVCLMKLLQMSKLIQ